VLFYDDRGCGPKVGGEEGGLVSCGDAGRSIGAKGEEAAFVSVRAEDHGNLWAVTPSTCGWKSVGLRPL
jgi:hypothetical protein